MAQHIVDLLRSLLAHYGYGAVAGALLLENAGLPVPGETVLLLASFLAYSEHRLRLPYIILIGICAATVGDNLGFAIVTVISSAGFFFGKHWDELVEILGDANVAVVIAICVLLAILWWRRRRRAADRS